MPFMLRSGLHIESVDEGFLVLVPGRDDVVHLAADQADAFRLIQEGADTVPDHLGSGIAALIEAGIVETDTLTRRQILALGGAGAAAGSPPATTAPNSTTSTTTTIPPGGSGNIYIADSYNRRVVRIDTNGTQTAIGTGLNYPCGVAVG